MKNQLDQIIERHATPAATAPAFRPFGDQDWRAFAGCESEEPEIAEHPSSDAEVSIEIVIDGATVLVLKSTDDGHGATWTRSFSSPTVAQSIARSVLLNEDPSNDFLAAMLGAVASVY